jgi:hypothetical protein
MPPYAARDHSFRNIRGTAIDPSGQVSPGKARLPSHKTTSRRRPRCNAQKSGATLRPCARPTRRPAALPWEARPARPRRPEPTRALTSRQDQQAGGYRLPRSRLSGSRPPRPGRPCGPSHAIGYADPGPGSHSPGIGAYEDDGGGLGRDTILSWAGNPYKWSAPRRPTTRWNYGHPRRDRQVG